MKSSHQICLLAIRTQLPPLQLSLKLSHCPFLVWSISVWLVRFIYRLTDRAELLFQHLHDLVLATAVEIFNLLCRRLAVEINFLTHDPSSPGHRSRYGVARGLNQLHHRCSTTGTNSSPHTTNKEAVNQWVALVTARPQNQTAQCSVGRLTDTDDVGCLCTTTGRNSNHVAKWNL